MKPGCKTSTTNTPKKNASRALFRNLIIYPYHTSWRWQRWTKVTQEEIKSCRCIKANPSSLVASYPLPKPPHPKLPQNKGLRKAYEAHQLISSLWLPLKTSNFPSSPPPEVQNQDPTRRARSPRPHSSRGTKSRFFFLEENGMRSETGPMD